MEKRVFAVTAAELKMHLLKVICALTEDRFGIQPKKAWREEMHQGFPER